MGFEPIKTQCLGLLPLPFGLVTLAHSWSIRFDRDRDSVEPSVYMRLLTVRQP